jgi:hypothetical protein
VSLDNCGEPLIATLRRVGMGQKMPIRVEQLLPLRVLLVQAAYSDRNRNAVDRPWRVAFQRAKIARRLVGLDGPARQLARQVTRLAD